MGTVRKDDDPFGLETQYDNTEFPQRRIWLDAYSLDRDEVSMAEYMAFLYRQGLAGSAQAASSDLASDRRPCSPGLRDGAVAGLIRDVGRSGSILSNPRQTVAHRGRMGKGRPWNRRPGVSLGRRFAHPGFGGVRVVSRSPDPIGCGRG